RTTARLHSPPDKTWGQRQIMTRRRWPGCGHRAGSRARAGLSWISIARRRARRHPEESPSAAAIRGR
ncbi:hypothetical protein OFB83_30020, partial [Escherichia coli]|nr:hypothetical protein [Escherichia coli]